MSIIKQLSVVLCAVLALGGCRGGGQIPISASDSADVVSGGNSGGGATTQGLGGGGGIGVTPEEAARQRLMQDLVVYFDFDRSEIRPEFNQMLAAHGSYLASNPNVRLRLEGHADETGSREYNIGLGERRAQAVRQILLLQGAAASQLETVSYGEERPAVIGSDEEAYRLNRRVELVYR
jgi:peptidoglycan-associated lipoprotein